MKKRNRIQTIAGIVLLIIFTAIFIAPDIAEAKGSRSTGRSFGGSRSTGKSFGSSRKSFSSPSQRSPSASTPRSGFSSPTQQRFSSFGGNRLSTRQDYTSKYGAPRRSFTSKSLPANARGAIPSNYVIHSYGGYGSGLMAGYMLGSTSWMWMMPFHPAYYYSKPYYSENPDGTVDVYPPTFSYGKLIFTLLIIAAIIFIIIRIINRRKKITSSSFS